MTAADSVLDRIAGALAPFGLVARGGFSFAEKDKRPMFPGGTMPASVVMIGHFGSSIWPHFSAWRRAHPGMSDPLDRWSKEILTGVAAEFGAMAVFPSDRPYLPFQQWAKRAEGLSASPLGLLIHPEYGLWQAFRGALLLAQPIDFAPSPILAHPCDACREKPCLFACPVNAFDATGFAVGRCRDHLKTMGQACMTGGCKARLACPVGAGHAYVSDQQRFHMRAFSG
ncbi:MAG: hypothetical protein ACRECY_18890 [Phyllobacterium sp.]